MRKPLPIDPVVIALEAIVSGDVVELSGIDLDTGGTVFVSIKRTGVRPSPSTPAKLSAQGLVLTLTVEQITNMS